MKFNWAENICRRFASDEIKALIDKLDTDDEFRKNYFEGSSDSRTITATYILQRKDTTYKLSMWDDSYAYHALHRIRSEYKIRKTKDTMLHIVMDTLEDKTTPPPAQSPTTTSYTSPLGGFLGGGSSISNAALNALNQQYTASQQLLQQQLGQKLYP